MDFRTQAKVTTASTLLSGLVGLGMAWHGCGVWSLAGQSLAQSLAGVALMWRWSPWRPTGRFRWMSVKKLWPFGWRMLASAQLNCVFENLYSLVIGRIYRPADLGFYTRASTLAMLPAGSVTGMTQRVMFPVFSSDQGDQGQTEAGLQKNSAHDGGAVLSRHGGHGGRRRSPGAVPAHGEMTPLRALPSGPLFQRHALSLAHFAPEPADGARTERPLPPPGDHQEGDDGDGFGASRSVWAWGPWWTACSLFRWPASR